MCKCDPSIRTPFCRRGDCFPPSEKGFKKRELAVVELEAYDAGFLSSYGEGNVQWWHDYMRAELERARTFYEQQVEQMLSGMAIVPADDLFHLQNWYASRVGEISTGDSYSARVERVDAILSNHPLRLAQIENWQPMLAAARGPATCSVCGLKRSDAKNCKAPDCSPMLTAAKEKGE